MTATGQVSAWKPTSSGHGGQEMGDHAWVESERYRVWTRHDSALGGVGSPL